MKLAVRGSGVEYCIGLFSCVTIEQLEARAVLVPPWLAM